MSDLGEGFSVAAFTLGVTPSGQPGYRMIAFDSASYTDGYAAGYPVGYSTGYPLGYTAGIAAAPHDNTLPVVTVTQNPTNEENAVIVSVYDETSISYLEIVCQDRTDGPKMVVYESDQGFYHPFTGRTTVTGAGTSANPYIFTVYRRGRWPTGIDLDFRVKVVDGGGNLKSTTVTIHC